MRTWRSTPADRSPISGPTWPSTSPTKRYLVQGDLTSRSWPTRTWSWATSASSLRRAGPGGGREAVGEDGRSRGHAGFEAAPAALPRPARGARLVASAADAAAAAAAAQPQRPRGARPAAPMQEIQRPGYTEVMPGRAGGGTRARAAGSSSSPRATRSASSTRAAWSSAGHGKSISGSTTRTSPASTQPSTGPTAASWWRTSVPPTGPW